MAPYRGTLGGYLVKCVIGRRRGIDNRLDNPWLFTKERKERRDITHQRQATRPQVGGRACYGAGESREKQPMARDVHEQTMLAQEVCSDDGFLYRGEEELASEGASAKVEDTGE